MLAQSEVPLALLLLLVVIFLDVLGALAPLEATTAQVLQDSPLQ
jgi:hypothetical protein